MRKIAEVWALLQLDRRPAVVGQQMARGKKFTTRDTDSLSAIFDSCPWVGIWRGRGTGLIPSSATSFRCFVDPLYIVNIMLLHRVAVLGILGLAVGVVGADSNSDSTHPALPQCAVGCLLVMAKGWSC